jgi:hypothetical protein
MDQLGLMKYSHLLDRDFYFLFLLVLLLMRLSLGLLLGRSNAENDKFQVLFLFEQCLF